MRVTVRIRCTARCVRLPRRHLSNRSSSRYAAVQVFAAHLCVVSRDAVEVTSSFGRAWDAVIDVFAEANKPIRTMERASGFIAAELATIPVYTSAQRTFAHSLADCGYRGRLSTYRRRRSTTSWYGVTARTPRFKLTVRYLSQNGATTTAPATATGTTVDCSTLGVLENMRESEIKARAEQGAPRATGATAAPTAIQPSSTRSTAPNEASRPMNVMIRLRFVDVEFERKRYEWDVAFVVRTGMGPVDLTQRNARITPLSANPVDRPRRRLTGLSRKARLWLFRHRCV